MGPARGPHRAARDARAGNLHGPLGVTDRREPDARARAELPAAGGHDVDYADVGQYLAHNLGLEEHGDTRSWLILKQAELARLA